VSDIPGGALQSWIFRSLFGFFQSMKRPDIL